MITVTRGDTASIPVTLPEGAFSDLTNATVFLTVKRREDLAGDDSSDTAAVLKKSTTLTSNANSWTFSLTTTDTNITPGAYVYDIQVKTSGGTVTTLDIADPWFIVSADGTRRVT